MSRCFCWHCAPVFGIIITNFTLSNNTFNLFTIYLSILQCTNYSHIAIVFPPLPLLDTHNRLFRRPSATYNSVNPGSFSKWRPAKDVKYRRRTRIQISASEALAKKFCYPFSWRTSVALINYALVSSGNPVRAHMGEFTMAAAGRAVPGISLDRPVSTVNCCVPYQVHTETLLNHLLWHSFASFTQELLLVLFTL